MTEACYRTHDSLRFVVSDSETEPLAEGAGEGVELLFGDSPPFEAPVSAFPMPACCTLLQVTISFHTRIASSASKWGLLRRFPPDCRLFQSLLSLYSVLKCVIFLWHWSTDFFIFCLSLSILVTSSQALQLSLLSSFSIFSPHSRTSTCSSSWFHRSRVFF